jgi:hypothetical protein
MTTAFLSQGPCFAESGASPPASRRRRTHPASRRPFIRLSSLAGPSLFGLLLPTPAPTPSPRHGDSTSRNEGGA